MFRSTLITVTSLLCLMITFCSAYPKRDEYEEERARRNDYDSSNTLEALRSLFDKERSYRGVFDCVEPFGACYGAPACCNENVCFWENGFRPGTAGECVPCVDRTQTCQRDDQCCEPLICQKTAAADVDGVCQIKLPNGASCYRAEQCQSRFCDVIWHSDDFTAQSGTCAAH